MSSYLGVGLGEWEGGTVEYLAVPKSWADLFFLFFCTVPQTPRGDFLSQCRISILEIFFAQRSNTFPPASLHFCSKREGISAHDFFFFPEWEIEGGGGKQTFFFSPIYSSPLSLQDDSPPFANLISLPSTTILPTTVYTHAAPIPRRRKKGAKITYLFHNTLFHTRLGHIPSVCFKKTCLLRYYLAIFFTLSFSCWQ